MEYKENNLKFLTMDSVNKKIRHDLLFCMFVIIFTNVICILNHAYIINLVLSGIFLMFMVFFYIFNIQIVRELERIDEN